MKVLIDTHAYLWWLQDADRLSATARSMLEGAQNQIAWSVASTWEMAIKLQLGKLRLPEGKSLRDLSSVLADGAISVLPIHQAHAVEVARLPPLHRDPFDRMLVAQARVEGLTILTADETLRRYDVETTW